MPIANRIVQVPCDSINFSRKTRQRTDLTPDSVLDLACSIARSQWISPILIDKNGTVLVAGERRLTAVGVLRDAVNGIFDKFTDPAAAKAALFQICSCKVDSWQQWTRIPAQVGENLTELDLAVYEFVENSHRKGLPWQDKARAVYNIHAQSLRGANDWSNAKTGSLIGLDHSTVAKYLKVWRAMEDRESPHLPDVERIVRESPTLQSALQNLDRFISRRQDPVSLSTTHERPPRAETGPSTILSPGPAKGTPKKEPEDSEWSPWEEKTDESFGESILLNADFTQWAEQYNGPPFNFIHCDFPYGISFNEGEQTGSLSSKLAGDYDDSPEIYWKLLETLAANQGHLIAPSAHIMFWFSQNQRRETEDYIRDCFHNVTLQDFQMIWHCTDRDGTVPDPQRYGRRTYETAMCLSFGDRKIVNIRDLSFGHPRESRSRIHRSQKPLTVLQHFMGMFVDSASTVLDPTAGSGTSLLAARGLGAKQVLGLELSKDTHKKAVSFLNDREAIVSL